MEGINPVTNKDRKKKADDQKWGSIITPKIASELHSEGHVLDHPKQAKERALERKKEKTQDEGIEFDKVEWRQKHKAPKNQKMITQQNKSLIEGVFKI